MRSARWSSPATRADEVERRVGARDVRCVRQEPQLGTGHAVQQAAPLLDDDGTTLILNGDVPLIERRHRAPADRRLRRPRGSRC